MTKERTLDKKPFHVLDKKLSASSKRAVTALQGHLGPSHEPIYLSLGTTVPTARQRTCTPRIIPLSNKIAEVGSSKIVLVTKDPISTYKKPIVEKGSVTEDTFAEIMPFRKFRSLCHSKKSAQKLYHDNDFILLDHRLYKLLPTFTKGTVFEKSGKRYPVMVQMAKPGVDAKLVKSRKSTKMKDERVDIDYLFKQVKMICQGTRFVPATGTHLDVVIGYADMEAEKLVKNIDCVVDYLTNPKRAPVGGVIKDGMEGIVYLHVRADNSASIPILEEAK